MRKGVLRNFAKFTGKRLCQILFFNKVEGLTFFTRTPPVADSVTSKEMALFQDKNIEDFDQGISNLSLFQSDSSFP